MTKQQAEVWARCVGIAFSEIIPTWPKGYTKETSSAAVFYTLWLSSLGYKIWDM